MSNGEYNMVDSFKVEKMSIRDSFFTKAMDKSIKGKKLYTIQDKCREYLGKNIVETRYKQLADAREKTFREYFREKGVNEQVKFSKGVNHVPYNGFSFYKIDYKGEIPYNLYKAYSKMNDLDDAPPRRRFKKERRKDRQLPGRP
jgi:hypothetical protein